MKIELDISDKDLIILDKAYEGRGGLVAYLNYEVKDKLEDYIKQAQPITIDEAVKDAVVADIEADAKEALIEAEKVV